MNFHAYLERIGIKGKVAPTIEELYRLQEQHLLHIPFENLDIHYGYPIVLETTNFYHKIVHDKRGGFCYELNGLFYNLLNWIGYDVTRLSARVFADGKYSEEFDHLALMVELKNKKFLVDVGFGSFSLEPLEITCNKIQKDRFGDFLINSKDEEFIVQKIEKNETIPQYKFTLKPRELSEFSKRCQFHQSDSNSHFTQQKMISLARLNGRITLTSNKLVVSEGGHIKTQEILHAKDFDGLLLKYFDITIHSKQPHNTN